MEDLLLTMSSKHHPRPSVQRWESLICRGIMLLSSLILLSVFVVVGEITRTTNIVRWIASAFLTTMALSTLVSKIYPVGPIILCACFEISLQFIVTDHIEIGVLAGLCLCELPLFFLGAAILNRHFVKRES